MIDSKEREVMDIKTLKIITIAETAALFICIVGGVILISRKGAAVPASTEVTDDEEVRVKPVLEKEEVFYQYDGRKILTEDYVYGQTFIPVYADVPVNELDPDGFVNKRGRMTYRENGSASAIAGVDISGFQGYVDWEAVKNAGYDFAMIRVGFRTYGGGELHLDDMFETNIQGAQAAGLDVGVYFYSQAISTEEANEEADIVLDAISGYDITYPVVFDWEVVTTDSARTDDVSVETLADMCVSFCERVKAEGYTPMVYQNRVTAMKKLDLPRIKDYDFWLAEYDDCPTYYYGFSMWQYANDADVPGIEDKADVNLCFVDYANGGKSLFAGSTPETSEAADDTSGNEETEETEEE